jgi:hypothetical protein
MDHRPPLSALACAETGSGPLGFGTPRSLPLTGPKTPFFFRLYGLSAPHQVEAIPPSPHAPSYRQVFGCHRLAATMRWTCVRQPLPPLYLWRFFSTIYALHDLRTLFNNLACCGICIPCWVTWRSNCIRHGINKGAFYKKNPIYIYICIFFFLDVFYTHKHSTKLCSNSLLFNYTFQNYLCSIDRARNASDADILCYFHKSFLFVYGYLDLEGSYSSVT